MQGCFDPGGCKMKIVGDQDQMKIIFVRDKVQKLQIPGRPFICLILADRIKFFRVCAPKTWQSPWQATAHEVRALWAHNLQRGGGLFFRKGLNPKSMSKVPHVSHQTALGFVPYPTSCKFIARFAQIQYVDRANALSVHLNWTPLQRWAWHPVATPLQNS